jgi:hypothetical protein
MDPCIGLQDGAYNTTSGWSFSSSNNFKILAYDFQPNCYGVQYGKFIMAANWTGASVRKSLPGVRSDLERFEYRFLGVENAAIVNLFLSIESLAIHLATSPTNEGLKTEFSRALARLSPYSISKSQEAVDIGSISGGNKYNVFDFFLPSARYSQNPLYYILYVYYPPSTVYSQISTGHFNYKSQEAVTASYTYSCEASDSRVGIYDAKNTCNAGYGNTVTTDFRNGISISYFKCFCDQSCASGWTYEGNGTSFFNHTATEGCNCNYTFSRACYNYFDTNGTKTGSSCPSDITQNVTASTYSPYRYDLNNFFFVNGETKSYDSSKTYANAVKNECIASVTSGSDTWLCFCGDGQLNISIRPTGVISGTMTYKNASNATVSTSVTNLSNQTINIDPSTHLYEAQGDGTYKITLTLTNVQISNPKMSNITSTIRHSHINIVADNLKNTNIVDFNKNVSGKPQYYGSITFGNDGNGGSLSTSSYSYSNIDHLKYWTNNSSAINGFYHQNIVGDFFAIIWDYNNLSPSINWSLNTGTDFGTYNNSYSFSGFHRSFFPWGVFTNQSQKYANFTSGNVALILGGFTLPLNYALCNNGYQASASTAVPSSTLDPDAAVISVAGDACDKLKAVADARVYLIKYRTTDTNLGNSKTALSKCAYGSSSPYIQTASNRDELVSALNAVAKDIKEFANHEDQYVEEK